jgi:polar amino acid transport system permease protein
VGYQFDFSAIAANAGLFAGGIGITLLLTAITAVVGLVLSVCGAAAMIWGGRMVRLAITAYVELIRNTPFIVQLFFIFFGLPSLGLRLTAFAASLLAMIVNLTAYGLEIVRVGILSVPGGQREAGLALGLRPLKVFTSIIFPQAIANVYPALASQIVIMMLESAVVSQIAVTDLTHIADYVQSRTYRAFETYSVTALIYLGLALLLRRVLAQSGRRLFAGRALT